MRIPLLPMLLLTLSLLSHGCVDRPKARASLERSVDHLADSALVIETRNGSIDVATDSALSEVVIEATFTCLGDTIEQARQRAAASSIDPSRDTSRTLTIRPNFPGGPRNGDGASFVVRLPDAQDVTIDTSNGTVKVARTRGMLRIDTSNGAITLRDHDGPALIETSNGSMDVQGHAGRLDADTSNGSLSIALAPDAEGPIQLDTSNGSVTVKVGAAFHGTVSLGTSNGRIKVDDQAGTVQRQDISRSAGEITVGEGGEASKISTSNGRITFVVRE